MLGKEGLYAFICVLAGLAIAVGTYFVLGGGPSPVLPMSMIIIGLGAALVVVRYGRLGPFQGAFGPPPVEATIRDRIRREVERSQRYGHEFSVLAMRQRSRSSRNLKSQIRSVDDVFPCRRGTTLLVLPETGRDGALLVHQRLRVTVDAAVVSAIVTHPTDGDTAEALVERLLVLLNTDATPGEAITFDQQSNPVSVRAHQPVRSLASVQ